MPLTKVLLATLTPGTVSAHYCGSLADLLSNPLQGVEVSHVLVHGGPVVAHQRNVVCKHFLETGYDYLLFVDSDIKFSGNDLKILLDSDKNIVGARSYGYSQARDESHPNWRPIPNNPPNKGLIECSHIGMDFTLIRRNALETLGVNPSELWPFGYGIVNGLATTTEDILFYRRAIERGLGIFVNADSRVYHAKVRLV